MRKIHVCIIASLILFTACKKDLVKSPASQEKTPLAFKTADQIPNEIVSLLYKDLLRDHLFEQAENLRVSYYNTLAIRKDSKTDLLRAAHTSAFETARQAGIMAANLPTHSVSGVGVVLDGTWYQTQGVTSSNLQAFGWQYINFNVMNAGAPDAFDNTAPGSTQIMGTTNQQRRLEAYTLPLIQFGAADNLGTTYYTPSFGFNYRSHLQGTGWEPGYTGSPGQSGTVGQSRRIESVQIFGPAFQNSTYALTFNDPAPSTRVRPYIYYRVHQEGYGWGGGWHSENDPAGVPGQSKRIEAMQIRAYLIKI